MKTEFKKLRGQIDFTGYVHDLKKSGKTQIVIRDSNDFAWCSGLASWLMENFEWRNINGDSFVAYINKIKPLTSN